MKNVYCVCYNSLYVFKNKKLAINFFEPCFYGSEGSERERYSNILVDLISKNIGRDRDSDEIYKIIYFDENNVVYNRITTNWENYKDAINRIEGNNE